MRAVPVLIAALAATLVTAAAADAVTPILFQINSFSGPRIWDEVASIPLGIRKPALKKVTYRIDGVTYRGIWANYSVRYGSTSQVLDYVYRQSSPPNHIDAGVFADRPLTRTERARFFEFADLYRDADVLVVAAGNPACAGLTRSQAHGVATGRYKSWSQVAGSGGAIHVRYLLDEAGGPEPHLGVAINKGAKGNYARGGASAADGGIAAAASGDQSIAAITTWSLARRGVGSACVVPIGGVAPSDETVMKLRYPEAFAVRYVLPRRRPSSPVDRRERVEFGKYLRSARLKKSLLAKGLLVPGEPAPGPPGPAAPVVTTPRTGHAGAISAARDDEALAAVLTGMRLGLKAADGTSTRLVLDPGGVLRRLYFDATGFCVRQTTGHWSLSGGWRYPEHGGGLIARVGWALDDPESARTIELPAAEPDTAYVDGTAYQRERGAAGSCG